MLILINIVFVFLSMSCMAASSAQPATTASAGPERQASVDQALDALDARGRGLKSFTADVKLSETDAATGDAITRSGKVWYQANNAGASRIRVVFDKKESNDRVSEDRIEYLLDGPDLIDRTYRTKTQVTRHILKPGEKMNLLKLGEGPFPLPIGQKKEDVHAMFEVKKIEPKQDDPQNTVHLQLTPKPDTRFERRFQAIDVWVDQADHMPHRIETVDKNGSTIRTTDMSNVQINPQLTDTDFSLPEIDEKQWNLMEDAYNE